MPAIAATLRAQAADSTRNHDSTAPAPEVPVVAETSESNMHSNLLPAAPGCAETFAVDPNLGMNLGLCITLVSRPENVRATC